MNYNEFADKIKVKYPQYKDMDNRQLAEKMIAKYPQYKDVTFDDVEESKGIDLTPSGLVKKAVSYPAAALGTAIYGGDFEENRQKALKATEEFKPAKGLMDFAVDTAVYSKLPMLRGGGVARGVGNAVIQGGVPGLLEGAKEGQALEGAGAGTAVAGGVNAVAPRGLKFINEATRKVLENPTLQKGVAKTLQAFTSVPEDYSRLALEREFAGDSILKGKFDADTAYQPIERKLREAKEMLPTDADFGQEFYKQGQKAIQGMEKLKNEAGQKIQDVLGKISQKEAIDINPLRNRIQRTVEGFAQGGDYNAAIAKAGKDIANVGDVLGAIDTPKKPIDLHNLKETLYDTANYDTAGGIRNNALKGMANDINQYLRNKFPEYQKPNDIFSTIKDVEYSLGGSAGISPNTIGGKLSNYGAKGNIESGLDNRIKAVNDILPQEYQFLKDTKNTIKARDEIREINRLINGQYERNPRLLANRTDEAFENALNDLQKKTGINFMDELNATRAREALEKWFPGQGGGSGSEQGFGNLLRTSLVGGLPTAAALTHNPAALFGLLSVSPKFAGQGTIKNLGRLYNTDLSKYLSPEVLRVLNPVLTQGAVQ